MRAQVSGSRGLGACATRVDQRHGIREEVEFLAAGADDAIFVCRHLPLGATVGAVSICPPILADFMANYRREVLIARALCQRGFAVQRFHYRGTGNSAGHPADVTFDSLREDALRAADRLLVRTGCNAPSFLGTTRWGALVAASACKDFPDAALMVWQPVSQPARFYREGLRAMRIRDVKDSRSQASVGLIEQIALAGSVDILGYPIHRALVESSMDRSFLGELHGPPRPLLLIQLSLATRLSAEYREIVAALAQRGFDISAHAVTTSESWWFHHERIPAVDDVMEPTVQWLEARISAELAS